MVVRGLRLYQSECSIHSIPIAYLGYKRRVRCNFIFKIKYIPVQYFCWLYPPTTAYENRH